MCSDDALEFPWNPEMSRMRVGKELILLFTFPSNNNKYLWIHAKQIFCIDGAAFDEKEKRLINMRPRAKDKGEGGEKGFEQKADDIPNKYVQI